jgi:hypothetical protein
MMPNAKTEKLFESSTGKEVEKIKNGTAGNEVFAGLRRSLREPAQRHQIRYTANRKSVKRIRLRSSGIFQILAIGVPGILC